MSEARGVAGQVNGGKQTRVTKKTMRSGGNGTIMEGKRKQRLEKDLHARETRNLSMNV